MTAHRIQILMFVLSTVGLTVLPVVNDPSSVAFQTDSAQEPFQLGLSQLQRAKQLKQANDAANQPQVTSLLVAATDSFNQLLTASPDVSKADQAYFHLGDAYELLDRKQDAIDAYKKIIGDDDNTGQLKLQAWFAIADLSHQLGQHRQAIDYFDQFLGKTKATGHPKRDVVKLVSAGALIALGQVAHRDEETTTGDAYFDRAVSRLLEIIGSQNAENNPSRATVVRDAKQQLAVCYRQQSLFQQAADLFAELSSDATSTHKIDLHSFAGASYLDAKQPDKAIPHLIQATITANPQGVAAARMLVAEYLNQRKHQAAYALAERFIPLAQPPQRVPLTVYQAEASMLLDNFSNAEKIYTRLTSAPQLLQHPNRLSWVFANANAKFQQENFAGATQTLEAIVDLIQPIAKRAATLHLLGVSHFRMGQHEQAMKHLSAALATDPDSPLTNDSRFFLASSQLHQNQFDQAVRTATAMAATSSPPGRLNSLYVQLGQNRYKAEQLSEAISFFDKVTAAKNVAPAHRAEALFGSAWAHLKNENPDTAEKLFTQLIDAYPTNPLIDTAKTGLATARRQAGKPPSSTDDPTDLLSASSQKSPTDDLFTIGRRHVGDKNWPAAIATFEQLLDADSKSNQIDKIYYELAWANRSANNETRALDYFRRIAAETPSSPLAAESNYHLGNHAYKQMDYSAAVLAFDGCMNDEDAQSKLREKAAYKSGWAWYKQNRFSEARSAFQVQTKTFPDGPLFADANFMIAESLFRDQQYAAAVDAYQSVGPVIAASATTDQNLRYVAILHGAQSANRLRQFKTAIAFADGIENAGNDLAGNDLTPALKREIFLERGIAHSGLKDSAKALRYWRRAARDDGRAGAQASCLIGDHLFSQQQHDAAISEYTKVFNGFGGVQAPAEIRPWQAYARHETGRCHFDEASLTDNQSDKQVLVRRAIEHFERLVQDYPNDKLVPAAERQIQILKDMKF